jgi:hypothetical protein
MSQKTMRKVKVNITYSVWIMNPGRHIDVLLSMTFAFGRRGYLKTSSAVVSWNHTSKALIRERERERQYSEFYFGLYSRHIDKYGMIV